MEAIGLTASLIAVMQLTETCIRIGSTVLGPTKHTSEDLRGLSSNLYNLHGTLRGLQIHYSIHEEDGARLRALSHLDEPYKRCEKALDLIKQRLEGTNFLGKYVVGTCFDSKLKKAMNQIAESQTLFETALLADNSVILSAVEQYLRNAAGDIRDIGAAVHENGKRLRDMDERLETNHKKAKRKERDDEEQSLLEWLSPLNFWAKHEDVLSRRCEGTGDLLLHAEKFKDWVAGSVPTLLCLGIPGAGKTVLTSIVVEHLTASHIAQDTAVVVVYFAYNEQMEQSLENLFGSILAQLLRKNMAIPDQLQYYASKRKVMSSSEYLRFIEVVIEKFSKVFIAVDALDECSVETRGPFLEGIFSLQPKVHLLCTSRYAPLTEPQTQNLDPLEIHATEADMMKYLSKRLLEEKRLSRNIEKDPALRQAILTTIVERSGGMFLLAQLHLDALAKKHSLRQVRKSLRDLPEKINKTYDHAMERIANQGSDDSQLAFRILAWIVRARRTLRSEDLRYALAIDLVDEVFDEEALPDEEFLVSLCAGLVTVEQQTRRIRLVHYTTQEYFEQNQESLFPNAACDIANACLIYLDRDWAVAGPRSAWKTTKDQLVKVPFLEYACVYWCYHIEEATEEKIFNSVLRFFKQDHKLNHRIWMGRNIGFIHNIDNCAVTGLTLASGLDLPEVAKALLSSGVDVNAISIFGGIIFISGRRSIECAGTALHTAATLGHERLVSLLLESGASMEIPNTDPLGYTALHCAVEFDQEPVVRLLLQKGANLNAKNCSGQSPFHQAVEREWKRWTIFCLANGANVEAETADWDRSKPLHLVHDRGADLESRDQGGYTPLRRAVERLTTDKDKDPNIRNGFIALIETPINKGASLAATTHGGYSSPLHLAEYSKSNGTPMKVLKLLLEHEADKEAKDEMGLTPLHTVTG